MAAKQARRTSRTVKADIRSPQRAAGADLAHESVAPRVRSLEVMDA
jgi:hypothetical protein